MVFQTPLYQIMESSFMSSEFQNFCKINGIKHHTSAPYKPASNGQAEHAVQIIKNGVSRVKEGSIQSRLPRVCSTTTPDHIKPPVAHLPDF